MADVINQFYDPEHYEPAHPAHELMAARYAPLTARPSSLIASSACLALTKELFSRTNQKPTRKQIVAAGALVAELLERDASDQGGWLYRSMNAASFTGQAVGQRPFMVVYSAMHDEMVEEVRGNRVWGDSQIAKSRKVPVWQRATRFRATPALLQWFADRGISRNNWDEHFERDVPLSRASTASCPLVLRSGKPPRHFGLSKGYRMPIDHSNAQVEAQITRMDRINAYLARVEVKPHGPVLLRRIFAYGDDPKHGWRKGGRLYAVGASPYQTAKRERRAVITINGVRTCELDIRASHVTILAGLGHIPHFDGDPYVIPGGPPRPVVKRWVNMTLSHGKRHARWPKSAVDDLDRHDGIDLAAYPIKETGDTILRHLPILKDDASSSVAVGWGELQFRESEVVLASMEVLAFEHDVPALPVHDSLIVPVDARAVAKVVLGEVFKNAFGVAPEIE